MKTKTKTLFITCALGTAILAGLFLTGCGGRRAKVEVNQSASVGQQLMDLEQSYQKGIITQRQYEDLKKEIIRKNN